MKMRGRSRKEQKVDQERGYNMMQKQVSKQAQVAFRHKAFNKYSDDSPNSICGEKNSDDKI